MLDPASPSATRILFFGRLAEQVGRERIVAIPDGGCTIAALRALLAEDESMSALAAGTLASVDQRMAGDDAHVHPGQEIAFFSPLSGG